MKSILVINQSSSYLFQDMTRILSSSYDIHVFAGAKYSNKTLFSRLISWSTFSLQLFFFLCASRKKYSCILYSSNPPLAPFISLLFSSKYHLLIYDLYPDALRSIKPSSLLLQYFLHLIIDIWSVANKRLFSNAQSIIAITDEMKALATSYLPPQQATSKISVMYPWADPHLFYKDSNAASSFKTKYFNGTTDGIVLSFTGNIGITHDAAFLVEKVLDYSGDAKHKLNLIVSTEDTSKINIRSHSSLTLLPYLDIDDYRGLLCLSDLTIIVLDKEVSAASIPSRFFSAIACGTPVLAICHPHSALARIINEYKCGLSINPTAIDFDQHLIQTLKVIMTSPQLLSKLSDNSLLAAQHFTATNATRNLIAAFS